MTSVVEELDLYYEDKEYRETYLWKIHDCSICGNRGLYRYAPHHKVANWPEAKRWLCEEHGAIAIDNPEWDYFPDEF